MQHVWSDSGDPRGYIIVDLDTKKWEHREFNAPKFINVKMPIDIKDLEPSLCENNYIRLQGDASILDFENVRDYILDNGAFSVEILPTVKIKPKKFNANITSLNEAIIAFEKESNVSEEQSETGRNIRSGTYGTTKYTN